MYNLKLIEYPNNTAQIRVYTKPVAIEKEAPTESNYGLAYQKQQSKTDEEKAEESKKKSLSRTKSKIYEYARCGDWEWFCTMTFSPSIVDRTDFKVCMSKMRNWLQNIRIKHAPNLQYLVVPELHADLISWHCHCLLANVGDLEFKYSGHIDEDSGNMIYNITNWKCGFSTATRIKEPTHIPAYICKYITKETHSLASGKNRYYVSNNLPIPRESTMLVEPYEQEHVIEHIAVSLGMEISWCSPVHHGSFTDVTYYELQ